MSGTITVAEIAAGGGSNNTEEVIKNCASLTDCMSKISNTQIDKARDIDIVMPMYNLIKYSDNYSKISRS